VAKKRKADTLLFRLCVDYLPQRREECEEKRLKKKEKKSTSVLLCASVAKERFLRHCVPRNDKRHPVTAFPSG
jgi:hypothetical protein